MNVNNVKNVTRARRMLEELFRAFGPLHIICANEYADRLNGTEIYASSPGELVPKHLHPRPLA